MSHHGPDFDMGRPPHLLCCPPDCPFVGRLAHAILHSGEGPSTGRRDDETTALGVFFAAGGRIIDAEFEVVETGRRP